MDLRTRPSVTVTCPRLHRTGGSSARPAVTMRRSSLALGAVAVIEAVPWTRQAMMRAESGPKVVVNIQPGNAVRRAASWTLLVGGGRGRKLAISRS
jgi:hypothetical protein